jgi:hypothetical protein
MSASFKKYVVLNLPLVKLVHQQGCQMECRMYHRLVTITDSVFLQYTAFKQKIRQKNVPAG